MPPSEITPQEALIRLGASTAEAVANVLELFAPGAVERGEVSVIAEGATPFANLPTSAVVASVRYIDGVTGANVFVMTPAGARALASAMGAGSPEAETPTPELSELEMSAIGEAANQMLAAAAAAISVVLGEEVAISPPDTRILADSSDPTELFGKSPHACSSSFIVCGEPCRLIQLVPSAFVVRMARAFDEMRNEQPTESDDERGAIGPRRPGIPDRCPARGRCAHLGRARPHTARSRASSRASDWRRRRPRPARRRPARSVRQRPVLRPWPPACHQRRRVGDPGRLAGNSRRRASRRLLHQPHNERKDQN